MTKSSQEQLLTIIDFLFLECERLREERGEMEDAMRAREAVEEAAEVALEIPGLMQPGLMH